MANVSYLRPSTGSGRSGSGRYIGARDRSPRPWVPIAIGVVVLVVVLGVGAIVLATSSASLTPGGGGLAKVGMPVGGGKLESVSVTAGPRADAVPVVVRGNEIWPRKTLQTGERVSIEAVVRRPGWNSWLTGSTQRIKLTTAAPSAQIRSRFITLHRGQPLRVSFDRPVQTVVYGPLGATRRRVLSSPQTTVSFPRTSTAGTVMVAGIPRSWEVATAQPVSWFPAGLVRASAVANPSPGTKTHTRPADHAHLLQAREVRAQEQPGLDPQRVR